ncbi:MAG: hypothetical protein HY331_07600, partial [Chloroflexi bacterium]|nr:hypothetical protein [Chloroflexota bacterium]
QNQAERTYLLNDEALAYLEAVGLSAALRRRLTALPRAGPQPEAVFTAWLKTHLPTLGAQQERWIREATAIAAYHAQTATPVVQVLLCDDAPQFKWVTIALALCWVRDARHSKKLMPVVAHHRKLLTAFLDR